MNIEIQIINQEDDEEIENPMEDAIVKAGLFGVSEAPRLGTDAYQRLMDAARGYIIEVKRVEQQGLIATDPTYNSEDDYYKSNKRKTPEFYLRESTVRRKFHDTIAKMLLGKERGELSKDDADKISDFAAYLTGNEEYVGRW